MIYMRGAPEAFGERGAGCGILPHSQQLSTDFPQDFNFKPGSCNLSTRRIRVLDTVLHPIRATGWLLESWRLADNCSWFLLPTQPHPTLGWRTLAYSQVITYVYIYIQIHLYRYVHICIVPFCWYYKWHQCW